MKKQLVSAKDYENALLLTLDKQIENARAILKYENTEYNKGYLKALEGLKMGILWNSPLYETISIRSNKR